MSDPGEKNIVVPPMMAELEWVWLLVRPFSKERDSIFVLEMEDREDGRQRRIVPVFETREDAAGLKDKLCGQKALKHSEQSMRLSEVGRFAANNDLEIMLLDGQGGILAHLEAKIEQAPVH